MTLKRVFKRLPEILLDDSGKMSTAKICILIFVLLISILVMAYCAFAFCEFSVTRKIPALPNGLAWTITSLVGGISALYGANKFSKTIPFVKGE